MTKKELINTLSNEFLFLNKSQTTSVVENVFEVIKQAVASGETVDIFGFGKFVPTLQKGKTGKIPGTENKTYTTQDKMTPKFKSAKAFKDAVSKGK